ncbi:Triphosphoribosyl-dephospho-CoA synthetase [Paramagnetospirillum magnetotacticum MS-1]|uniref:Probable 2-(5''-triphosphoribosyl)-3'-dephosphocoenzyme-A synthase n=1 Tax=Paramagnetospirillum magnetotacticum MS-1 TaxID=272627 RepID=A0A0C2YAF4_PARME|nr:Triphosphoribosyl-dephospho-CoA synthetase [Paramagnetospirillum magnetotacticum MS-1]
MAALHAELALYPKPGLVSPMDSGAHSDMDATTFLRSLFALRHYFVAIAAAGEAGMPFEALRQLGVAAERRMLAATGGINTHRGAIFCLGLLAAAAGWRQRRGLILTGDSLAETVVTLWGDGIAASGSQSPDSNGSRATRRYGARSARDEALEGFPTLMGVAVPELEIAQARLGCPERARLQALFAVMADLEDTNLLHRGGPEGLRFVQTEARRFLDHGGVFTPHWRTFALGLHRACIARNLSPGGAADTLAAACFVQSLRS